RIRGPLPVAIHRRRARLYRRRDHAALDPPPHRPRPCHAARQEARDARKEARQSAAVRQGNITEVNRISPSWPTCPGHPRFYRMRARKTWMPGTIGERSDAVLRTAKAGHDEP